MRRVGDAEWRWFGTQADAARAFGVTTPDVSELVRNVSRASLREAFEARSARTAPPKKRKPTASRKRVKKLCVEGAAQKQNGKWVSQMFPGREFDDLDEYRAAKKQRKARLRKLYDQNKN